MRQREAPFFQAVLAYADAGIVPFHTPGHKQGRGASRDWVDALSLLPLRLDVSDVLSSPEYNDSWTAALEAAECLAAEAFGADFCRFLVNGTTGGVHAMLMATAPGRPVVVARNSHRSVIGAIILADAWPVYVEPTYDFATNVWLPPPLNAWEEAFDANPDAAAVLVTYPTYEGVALDLGALTRAARARGLTVLVDEAHGPHFGLHSALPPRALQHGADLSAQSPHKLLGSLTQSSWLLGREGRVTGDTVRTVLGVLQTTSPSALLLASLDVARRQVVLEGEAVISRALAAALRIEEAVHRLQGLEVVKFDNENVGIIGADPTKLLIAVDGIGWDGFAAAAALRAMGVQVEMGTAHHVLALATLGDTDETVDEFCRALEKLAAAPPPNRRAWSPASPPIPRQVMRPREAALAPAVTVPLADAAGHVASDIVCPYPPGIPVLCPGEQVSSQAVAYLQDILHRGGEVRGLVGEPDAPAVRVVGAR